MDRADVIIIGGGMAGASAAYELALDARVLLLEREAQVGYHSTGRSAATFSETYGNTTVRWLTIASRPFFEMPPAGFAEHPLLADLGVLTIAGRDHLDRAHQIADELHASFPRIHFIDAESARTKVPVLREDYLAGGIWKPDVMNIDVDALHQGFLRGAKARGAQVITGVEVTTLEREGGGWVVKSATGAWTTDVVVNAAGAWADTIAHLAGVRPVGVIPKRRTAVIFNAPEGLSVSDWPLVADIDEQFYFKPEAGKLLGSPCDETPVEPCDALPEELDIAHCIDRIQRAADLPVRRVEHAWAGLRSFAADRAPVVGFEGEVKGFFWLAGQGGYGIQTAPAMARLVGSLLSGRGVPDDLREMGLTEAMVSPERFRQSVVSSA